MNYLASLVLFFSAVVIHEYAHAFVAYRRGDTTAQRMGRLTLNPLAHIDPFGTIALPLMLLIMNSPVIFGWAKPVPVNFSSLRNPKKDMIWVGLAGPLANLLLAFGLASFLKTGVSFSPIALHLIQSLLIINVVLAVFNMIPIPPLDGSRVLMGLLPLPLALRYAALEPYGFLVLFALLYMGLFDKIVWPIAGTVLYLLMKV